MCERTCNACELAEACDAWHAAVTEEGHNVAEECETYGPAATDQPPPPPTITARQVHDWLVEWGMIQARQASIDSGACGKLYGGIAPARRILEARTRDLFFDLSKYGVAHPVCLAEKETE